MFEVFSRIVHAKELHNHPGVKAIMTVGQLVADAACDVELDGRFTAFSFTASENKVT